MTPLLLRPLFGSPDLALLAVAAGLLLLYAECNVPGAVFPGCLGVLLLMLGLLALSHLPLRVEALGLTFAGFALVLLAVVSSRALLPAMLGLAVLTAGLRGLIDSSRSSRGIDLRTALLAALLLTASTVWLGRVALRARRNKQRVSPSTTDPQGRLRSSELW